MDTIKFYKCSESGKCSTPYIDLSAHCFRNVTSNNSENVI